MRRIYLIGILGVLALFQFGVLLYQLSHAGITSVKEFVSDSTLVTYLGLAVSLLGIFVFSLIGHLQRTKSSRRHFNATRQPGTATTQSPK